MIVLRSTTTSLRLTRSVAASVDVFVSYIDHAASGGALTGGLPGSADFNFSTAATDEIVAAPASNTYRQIVSLWITNRASVANTVRLEHLDDATTRYLGTAYTLGPGESLAMIGKDLAIMDASGRKRVSTEIQNLGGYSSSFIKNGTTPEGAANFYLFAKDAGSPGAWAVGTPGLAGRATDGTAAADAGALYFRDAVTGGIYLRDWNLQSSRIAPFFLIDLLWVNSGIAVTTTTAQTINSVAFPARDVNGGINGLGCMIGLLVTTATTNGAAISNSTVSYTDELGNAGAVATLGGVVGYQIPATAVAGTFIPFHLAAGDRGVQSIQSITLNTSLGGGAVSLCVFRVIDTKGVITAGLTTGARDRESDVRLYNGSCLFPLTMVDGTTAYTIMGSLDLIEK